MSVSPDLTAALHSAAAAEGFSQCGVAAAVEPRGFSRLLDWITAGYAGSMQYIPDRRDAYRHPSGVLEGARSVVMLTYPYPRQAAEPLAAGRGRMARYLGSGADYHDVIHPKLKRLRRILQEAHPESRTRGVIDTAPLLERDFGRLAGLGWQGKNTLLIDKFAGSYFFLAALVTDLALPVDLPHESSHCGTCRRCLDACPTDAFPEPGVLDARRCISYLTIESREPIPLQLREAVGSWFFGCDVCQEVCPWNRPRDSAPVSAADEGTGGEAFWQSLSLLELFDLDGEAFRARFRKTPLWRSRRSGILRNAAIVLGNQRAEEALPALRKGLLDPDPLVRGAAAWAIGRVGAAGGKGILRERLAVEADAEVRSEIERALRGGAGGAGGDERALRALDQAEP
ncbi:tRNA epoxyqueuosine(34) reductase QueG [Candidatus Laterigemmans baculatus]|uniref:tRNA epoxyqueuosine(34) reductase QueG n=1 Tax=Candidatus Laterigemmans baculatus TaxID=2770505 RepID=UPI0013DCE32A|nr:tRNA epoxyqueuosine(34) reductase QueG [Candidatus Laterigemmans baculatus]